MTVHGVGLVESTTTEDEMLSQAKIPTRPAKHKPAASPATWRVMHWQKPVGGQWGALVRVPARWEYRTDDGSFREQRQRKRVRWQGREAARRVARVVRGEA